MSSIPHVQVPGTVSTFPNLLLAHYLYLVVQNVVVGEKTCTIMGYKAQEHLAQEIERYIYLSPAMIYNCISVSHLYTSLFVISIVFPAIHNGFICPLARTS
jgi:hypothetical protein